MQPLTDFLFLSPVLVALYPWDPGLSRSLNSTVGEDTLLHGETIAVVSTGNFEDIALELFSESIGLNFLAHALLLRSASIC
jgi:hypothetical protein